MLQGIGEFLLAYWDIIVLVVIIPIINELVKLTPTEKDDDVWKVISYAFERLIGLIRPARFGNRSKKGKNFPVYADEESKPAAAIVLDRVFDKLEKRLYNRKIKEND